MSRQATILILLVLLITHSNAKSVTEDSEKQQFRFFINADSQMGPEHTAHKNLIILNELLENFVEEVNRENKIQAVDFVVYNGDLVWDPYQDAFDNFTRIVSKQEVPIKLVHGNHDGYDDDPKFFQTQKKLSGYEKLNYSFDYGNWHFVVIGAQEKYQKKEQRDAQLEWIKNELATHKNKQIMLFMHYHIMPVGLSQMEFYTYWPLEFKNQILDLITEHENVKYVFNGHVHSGVKASVKSSVEFKGTKFINSPTPVKARPFGEEYSEYESDPDDRYFRRGFYLEVVVDGDDVKLVGHKINHKFEAQYPIKLKQFKVANDPRFFKAEASTKPNKNMRNPSFNKGFKGWKKSYRYKKDKQPAFNNVIKDGSNVLKLKAPWGTWNFDEYMETYQVVEFDSEKNSQLVYDFDLPKFSKQGAGGYIKLNLFDKNKTRVKTLLLHWGSNLKRVRFMYQSWFFNADGEKFSSRHFDNEIKNGKIISIPLEFDKNSSQVLSINLNDLLMMRQPDLDLSHISHMTASHGVWTRILRKESKIMSQLNVNSVFYEHQKHQSIEQSKSIQSPIMLNNHSIDLSRADKSIPYYSFERREK